MANNSSENGPKIVAFKTPEPRFPQAAVTYIDSLLSVQREQFEQELANRNLASDKPLPPLPESLQIFAESDSFIGAGWSSLGQRRDGTNFRWMGRIGSLLIQADLSQARSVVIKGCGFTKRRFLKEATLWIDDTQIATTLTRRGFNRWSLSGEIPASEQRPVHLLRLQAPGVAPLAEGIDTFVSLAVSEVRVNC